ncbi:transient receptor potential cation channel subfamily a member 1-like [Gigaspora margarita]|uniref:Transient receptor potential cation channel subfamily a member 1-like n=1 Tax=Gigaspora margarita TaxID=4874 RepID=A0A8H4ETV7_GIGMA|nr:transient receptor potential cation channel subfamily a member 1-like [Gigaspora margarita]
MAEPNDNETSIEVVSNELPPNETTPGGSSSNVSEGPKFIYDISISPNFKYVAVWGLPRDSIFWKAIEEGNLIKDMRQINVFRNTRNREIKYVSISENKKAVIVFVGFHDDTYAIILADSDNKQIQLCNIEDSIKYGKFLANGDLVVITKNGIYKYSQKKLVLNTKAWIMPSYFRLDYRYCCNEIFGGINDEYILYGAYNHIYQWNTKKCDLQMQYIIKQPWSKICEKDAIYSLKFDHRAAFSNTKKLMATIDGRELLIFSVKTGIPIITKNLNESFNCLEFVSNGHDEYLLVYFRPNKRCYDQEYNPLNNLDKVERKFTYYRTMRFKLLKLSCPERFTDVTIDLYDSLLETLSNEIPNLFGQNMNFELEDFELLKIISGQIVVYIPNPKEVSVCVDKYNRKLKIDLKIDFENKVFLRSFNDEIRNEVISKERQIRIMSCNILQNDKIIILTKCHSFIFYESPNCCNEFNIDLNRRHPININFLDNTIALLIPLLALLALLVKKSKVISIGPTLQIPVDTADSNIAFCRMVDEIIYNKLLLVEYGPELLRYAIRSRYDDVAIKIFEKSIEYFNENPLQNACFLGIISYSFKSLQKHQHIQATKFIDLICNNLDPLNPTSLNSFKILYLDYSHLHAICHNLSEPNIKLSIKFLESTNFLPIIFSIFDMFIYWIKHYYSSTIKYRKQCIILTTHIPKFVSYPEHYNFLWEFIFGPAPNSFVSVDNNKLYQNWNIEAIINFKWNAFASLYHSIIWAMFIAYFVSFLIVANTSHKALVFLRIIITYGAFNLIYVEFRKFLWSPLKYITNLWNWFDIGAYIFPVISSIFWLNNTTNLQIETLATLLLYLKFILFFRAFSSFGIYFAIFFGVARRVFPFFIILIIILIGFAHSFYILLHPQQGGDDDPNDPWNLSNAFYQKFENGSISPNPVLVQAPNSNTNMYADFRTALIAMYMVLAGMLIN